MMAVTSDLHTHTSATDGRSTGLQLLDLAAQVGLSRVVITDHSWVSWADFPSYAASLNIEMPFPGTEVSTELHGKRHHLLLFGRGLLNSEIQEYLYRPNGRKNKLAQRALEIIYASGNQAIDPTSIALDRSAPSSGVGSPLAVESRRSLTAQFVRSGNMDALDARRMVDQAFQEASENLKQTSVYLPTLEVLDMARSRGITTVLAHPFWQCSSRQQATEVLELLPRLVDHGLRGIENRSYHHRHLDDLPELERKRKQLNLLHSGGSDFHANGKTQLGSGGLKEEEYQELAAEIARLENETQR